MKRLVSLGLALILIAGGFCTLCRATETVDVLVGDIVDIWVSISNGGTALLTPDNNSPAPVQSTIVLGAGQSGAFHVRITDVGVFTYSLSVLPDGRNIVFDSTVYDVEIHALYDDDVLRTAVVVYNRATGEKYTPDERYDPITGTYTHSLSVSFSNIRNSGGGGGTPSHGRPPNVETGTGTGKTPPDTGNTPPDTGKTPPDTGNTPPDTGNTPPDTGNTPPDTGDTPPDTGKTPPDTGNTPPDTGKTPPDTGKTPPDTPDEKSNTGTGNTPNKKTGTGETPNIDTGTDKTVEVKPSKAGKSEQQPKTGDDSQLTRYLLLAIFSSAGLFVVSVAYYISVDIEIKTGRR